MNNFNKIQEMIPIKEKQLIGAVHGSIYHQIQDWNKYIDFYDAFRTSCVWYFREVVDEIGKDAVQDELNKLQYGNCDISDWGGQLNTNNSNPALTGF